MIFESIGVFLSKVMLFTGYLNENVFPQPLTKEEEIKYLKKMKKGDKSAKNILINHNLRLVAHIVKKYQGSGDADDLISVGSIGLIKAINTFDVDKGALLSTYASRCIENEILMLIRNSKKHFNTIGLDESVGVDKDGVDITLMDIIPDDESHGTENVVENNILTEKLQNIINSTLNEREKKVIEYRFGINGKPVLAQREVAKLLGISRSYISRIEKKALQDMRNKVDDLDLYDN